MELVGLGSQLIMPKKSPYTLLESANYIRLISYYETTPALHKAI